MYAKWPGSVVIEVGDDHCGRVSNLTELGQPESKMDELRTGLPRGRGATRASIRVRSCVVSTITAGRSFQQGEVTRAELLKLTSQFEIGRDFFAPDMDGWHYDVRLVEGDLYVPGRLDLFAERLAALVVTGNLDVQGTYGDGDDPWSGAFVLGDMRAANVVTAGSLNVAGSLTVAGGIVGDYNDYSATIGGQTTARYLHTEHHWFDFGAAVKVEYVLGPPRGSWPKTTRLEELPAASYPDVLMPEVFSPDPADLTDEERAEGWFDLDHSEIMRRTSVGEPVLLDPA